VGQRALARHNRSSIASGNGPRFMLDAMRKGEPDGSAWVEYQWYNPCSGKPIPKSLYIVKAGEFFIDVSAYGRLSV